MFVILNVKLGQIQYNNNGALACCNGNTNCLSCADKIQTTLKLAPLLAEYLYQQKKLDLAGIGTFSLDPSARINSDAPSEGISFEHNASVKDDDKLIGFISTETGKMRTLASSDLASYVELGLQFLNIGKPLQIEGIGTLVKNKSGELEFTADHVIVGKVKETGIKELSATSISDGLLTTYDTLKPKPEKSPRSKKFFLAFLALATVAAIIWISYRLNQPDDFIQTATPEVISAVADTTSNVPATDTMTTQNQPAVKIANNSYRFVIEVANKKRAFYRYYMLKKGNLPVQMSTTDSTTFKLYFVLPATAPDTARIADSLTSRYPALNKRKTFAEQ